MNSEFGYPSLQAIIKHFSFKKRRRLIKSIPSLRPCLAATPHTFQEIFVERCERDGFQIHINKKAHYRLVAGNKPEAFIASFWEIRSGDVTTFVKYTEGTAPDLQTCFENFMRFYMAKKGTVIQKFSIRIYANPIIYNFKNLNIGMFQVTMGVCRMFPIENLKCLEDARIDDLNVQYYTDGDELLKKLETLRNIGKIYVRTLDLPASAVLEHFNFPRYKFYEIREYTGMTHDFIAFCKVLQKCKYPGCRYAAYVRDFRGCFSVLLARLTPDFPKARRKFFLIGGNKSDFICLGSEESEMEVVIYVEREMLRPYVAQVVEKRIVDGGVGDLSRHIFKI